jgi:hypothetical protein
MRDRQRRGWLSPVRALATVLGGTLIVLTATAAPALADSGSPSSTPSATAASSPSSSPSLGIGSAISTSRRPPASALATLGVDAASGSAAPLESASSVPALLPTGVNAGHGAVTGTPLLSEVGAGVALALLAAVVLYRRRRTGTHHG